MSRTKGALGRDDQDTVKALKELAESIRLKAREQGCRACCSGRELVAVPITGYGHLASFSRLPYQKGMTSVELQELSMLYRWVCRKCLRGTLYPPEWTEGKKDVDSLDARDGICEGALLTGEPEEITYNGTVLWRRVGRIQDA